MKDNNGISIRWFFLPPFVATFTLVATNLVASGHPTADVDPAVWGLVGLLFIILTVLYALFIREEFFRGLFPVQLVAQGLLLCPLALRLGANMLQWLGVTMTICGAVILVAQYYFYRRLKAWEKDYMSDANSPLSIDALPFPFAITDAEGTILTISDGLLKLTDLPRESVEGGKITLILPLNRDTVVLNGKEWKIVQSPLAGTFITSIPGSGKFCFQLEENAPPPVAENASAQEECFVDSETSLYSRAYAIRRVQEEMYRIQRYERWMSAALFRMFFAHVEPDSEIDKEETIFRAYCHFIREHTRESDISCLVGPREVLLVMPETLREAAEEVAGKLADFVPALQDHLEDYGGAAEVRVGTCFFGIGSGDLSFDDFLEKLDEALASSMKS